MKSHLLILCFLLLSYFNLKAANFSGEYNVGEGQTYTSLSKDDASGFFKAVNEGTVTGNIIVYITSNLIETGAIPLQAFASPFTITIKPDAPQLRNIAGSNFQSRGIIRFSGTDRVTIDGSYNNTGKYLSFKNEASGGHFMTLQLESLGPGAGCTDFVIRNCNFLSGSTGSATANTINIQIGGLNTFDGGADHSNILIEKNTFNATFYGLFVKGISGYKANNITIQDNNFGNNLNSIGSNSIYLIEASDALISGNTITGYTLNTDVYVGQIGMALVSCTNTQITRNRISGMKTQINGSKGIVISNSSNTEIANNLIYDIGGPGYSNIANVDNPNNIGIQITGTAANVNIYYNSIHLFGSFNKYMSTVSAGLFLSSQCSGINLKDNIISNNIANNYNSSSKCYLVYNAGNNGVYSSTNYNDYYGTGTQYVFGFQSSDISSLAEWQAATGGDQQSLNLDPQFQSGTLIQPQQGSPVLAAGTPIAGITTDFDIVTRSATNPSMGAYEGAFELPSVDWCNLSSPHTALKAEGLTITVKALVEESGITEATGQGENIEAWIGWNNEDTDPSTWTNWKTANYAQDAGNRDEYEAIIGGDFSQGTYYFASRFKFNSGNFRYGGYSGSGGGFWNGTVYISGELTVTNNIIEWANLASPGEITITQSEATQVLASIKVPDVTTLLDESPGIYCEIGYWYEDTNPNTWPEWQWLQAGFLESENEKHTYKSDLVLLYPGTYYLAARFFLCNDPEVYGGYSASGGGFWDGTTNVSGIVTVEQLVVTPPYSQNFNTNSIIPAGWLFEDVNEDGVYWENVIDHMEIGYDDISPMDDWLFSPGIYMQAGVTYAVQFDYGNPLETGNGKLELKYGNVQEAVSMTNNTSFANNLITSITDAGYAEITPSATGVYFLGWHGFSDQNQISLTVDNVEISVIDSWTGLISQLWSNPNNWLSGTVPISTTTININSPNQVIVDLPHAHCGKLTIMNGAKLIINPGMGLEVHTSLVNQGDEQGILVKSDATGTGQLLHPNTDVKAVFQRYIGDAEWNNGNDGWHFVSSPINGQPIAGSWTPTGENDNYDFYLWDSDDVLWLNQKDPANGITHFGRGVGYLVAYEQTKTHAFSGTMFVEGFNSDIQINKDSWVPLGNPYPTALKWNDGDWMLDGYAAIAKAWERDIQSYIDIYPGDIIPATNGFMGFGECIGALVYLQMSIPASARVISSTPFLKSAGMEGVFLSVKEKYGKAEQQCNIVLHNEATDSFNRECDSYFNSGYAPQFYAVKGGEALSTYATREFSSNTIDLVFVKNNADEFEFILDKTKTSSNIMVHLIDLKTSVSQDLTTNPVYSFTSDVSDDPNRFKLRFGTLGNNETELSEIPDVYTYGQQLFVSGAASGTIVQILDINGRLIKEYTTNISGQYTCTLNLSAGAYFVRLADRKYSRSVKIILV